MQNSKNLISFTQYLRLKDFVDVPLEATRELPETGGEVVDFFFYKNRAEEKQARCQRANLRALSILGVIKGLVKDYATHMHQVAENCDYEEYVKQYGHDAKTQIQEDMRRLNDFTAGLEAALVAKQARTLMEAGNVLRKGSSEEIVDTFNYILVSDYFGFQAIKTLVEAARLTEEAYLEDTTCFYSLWNQFSEANFSNSLEAIAVLCFEEAVAI